MPGNLWLEEWNAGQAQKGGEGESCRGTGRLQWREQSVQRFPGGEDMGRFARKMRSLCLALPFQESGEMEEWEGQGGLWERGLRGGIQHSLASRELSTPGSCRTPSSPGKTSLPEERMLGLWKSSHCPPSRCAQIQPDLHPTFPLSLPGQDTLAAAIYFYFVKILFIFRERGREGAKH